MPRVNTRYFSPEVRRLIEDAQDAGKRASDKARRLRSHGHNVHLETRTQAQLARMTVDQLRSYTARMDEYAGSTRAYAPGGSEQKRAVKTARQWEARARRAEKRLRDKGVTNVPELSPLASAGSLEAMTAQQLRRYTKHLREFADARYMQLPSGEAVNRADWKAMKRDVARENRRRAERAAKLDAVEVTGAVKTYIQQNQAARLDPNTLKRVNNPRGTGSPLEPIIMDELPRTAATFRRRGEALRGMARRPTAEVIAGQRRSAIGMARQLGNKKLERMVSSMSDFELSFMVERMDLLGDFSLFYTSKEDMRAGVPTVKDLSDEYDPGSFESNISAIEGRVSDALAQLRRRDG